MSQSLEFSFNPAVVADLEPELSRREALARSVPLHVATLRYGGSPRQKIDFYRPAMRPNPSVLLYFHGGYWHSGGPAQSAFVAGPFLTAGISVAIAGYDLCPDVTLGTIVDEARAARDILLANAAALGIDIARIIISGSSAGAHLCAMLLQDGASAWPLPPVASLVTGVYDIGPVLGLSINATLGLVAADIEPLSPLRRSAPIYCRRLLLAVGGEEPAPWQAMSAAFAEKARADGVPTEYVVFRGENHFSLTTAFGLKSHLLAQKTLALLARSS